jgi:hypothetical protein
MRMQNVSIVILFSFFFTVSCVLAVEGYGPNWTWDDPESYEIACMDMNMSGTTFAIGTYFERTAGTSAYSLLAVFDWKSPYPIFTYHFRKPGVNVTAVAVSECGEYIACATSIIYDVMVFHIEEGLIWRYSHEWLVRDLQFDENATTLMVAQYSEKDFEGTGILYLYDMESGERILYSQPDFGFIVFLQYAGMSDDGSKIMTFYKQGITGSPGYALLYDPLKPNPEIPVWTTQPVSPNFFYGELAKSGDYFVMGCENIVYYFDMSPPVDGIKEPLWSYEGCGVPALTHRLGLSWDGKTPVGHFAPFLEGGDPGCVEVLESSMGVGLWSTEMFAFQNGGAVSGDGLMVFASPQSVKLGVEPVTYAWNLDAGDVVWSVPEMGFLQTDWFGQILLMGGGYYSGEPFSPEPLRLYFLEQNLPPECLILSPENDESVTGITEFTGTASDPESKVINVEIFTPAGVFNAESTGEDFSTWRLIFDMSQIESGSYTFKARAVDENYKHGPWDEIQLRVETPVYPTPTPGTPPDDVTIYLRLSKNFFRPGDVFKLETIVWNPDLSMHNVMLLVCLEAHGTFFFWPSWTPYQSGDTSFDFGRRDFSYGETVSEIIPAFFWPDIRDWGLGYLLYACLLSPDGSELLSNIDIALWGFGPP